MLYFEDLTSAEAVHRFSDAWFVHVMLWYLIFLVEQIWTHRWNMRKIKGVLILYSIPISFNTQNITSRESMFVPLKICFNRFINVGFLIEPVKQCTLLINLCLIFTGLYKLTNLMKYNCNGFIHFFTATKIILILKIFNITVLLTVII